MEPVTAKVFLSSGRRSLLFGLLIFLALWIPASSEPAYMGIPAPAPGRSESRLTTLSPVLEDPAPLPVPPIAALDTAGQDVLELSLEEAARVALAHSPRIDAAMAQLKALQEEAEVVAAPARPLGYLNLSGEQLRQPEGPPVEASFLGITASFRSEATGTFERNTSYFELRQLLFDGGRVLARVEQAKESALESERLAVAEWHQLSLDVRTAFLDVLQAQAESETAEEAVAIAQHSLRIAEAQYRAGAAPRGDIVFAQLPLARAELFLTESRQAVQSTQEELNRLLGLPQETALRLREPEAPGEIQKSREDSIEQAYAQRPDVLALGARIRSAERGVVAAQRDNNAALSFVSSLDRVGFDDKILNSGGFQVGLRVEWPFLDGNRHTHLARQAEARQDDAQAQLVYLKQNVEREVREAYRAVELAAQSYQTALVEIGQAREALRIAEGQYKAGFADFFPVRDSQRDLVVAKVNRARARYDYLRARARLVWARGDDPGVEFDPNSHPE